MGRTEEFSYFPLLFPKGVVLYSLKTDSIIPAFELWPIYPDPSVYAEALRGSGWLTRGVLLGLLWWIIVWRLKLELD